MYLATRILIYMRVTKNSMISIVLNRSECVIPKCPTGCIIGPALRRGTIDAYDHT